MDLIIMGEYMAEKIKERYEIEECYKWDLKPIYKTYELWEKDYKEVLKSSKELEKYKGHLLDNSNTFLLFLEDYFKGLRNLEKVYVYTHLLHDSETSIEKPQIMYSKAKNAYKDFSSITSFVEPELLLKDYSIIEKFYKEEPKLLSYKRYLEEIYRMKKHTLSEKEERLLSSMYNVLSSPSDTYDMLVDTDLKFNSILDENSEEVELSEPTYYVYSSSDDRRVRHDAFTNLYKGYESIINTAASTLSGNINAESVEAKLRCFNSSIEASLYPDNISVKVYDSLIRAVNLRLDSLHKYYELRKEILGLTELHLYDMNNDIVPKMNKKYTFEEAKEIALASLSPLGEDYLKIVRRAFDERWIDVYPNKNKRSGGYASGCYETYPYILLNFKGQFEDVRTLVHELGHAVHSYYSRKNNPYHESDYKIFVAEVASTVNELLLFDYVYNNTTDKKEKLSLLNDWISSFKASVYRQTMFAEFEKDIYSVIDKDEVLTKDYMCNLWYSLCKKYFGPSVVVDEDIKYEWARIPHFYNFFYVYKYATGKSAACYIANNLLSKDKKVLDSYIEFLKSGNKDYPIEELKIAGVDMNNKEVVSKALDMFNDYVNKFSAYNKEVEYE